MNTGTATSQLGPWLRYWRNSMADAESARGALGEKELKPLWSVETKIYQEGRLPSAHPVLDRLFEDEPEETQLVRVVLRPAVYRSLHEHGKSKQALFPEVVTPLICVLWVTRQGDLIPAEPPVIPRDLLSPQADDRFTLGEVEAQDRLLSREAVSIWSQQAAKALVEEGDTEAQEKRWRAYYEISRSLFEQLIALEPLKANFESLGEARLLKVEQQTNKGAAQHILNLYDWLGETDRALPLLERYALSHSEESHRPCSEALLRLDGRLGHANTVYPLASAQRDALAQAMAMEEGEILAVNGPPGTGKTTFVLSVVASRWVKAALEESEPPLIVAASTNNQAVTNILAAFAKDFEENDGPLGGRWLPSIDSYGGFYPARSREDEAAKEYQTPAFYRRLEHPEYLEHAEGEFLAHARAALDDETLTDVASVRRRLHGRLTATHDQLADIQACWQTLCTLDERLGDNAEARQLSECQALDTLHEELTAIEEAARRWKRFCADESLWLSVLSVFPPVARRRRLKRELFIDEALNDRAKAIIHGAAAEPPETALGGWLADQQARIEQQRQGIEARQALLDERAAEAARLLALLPETADAHTLDAIDKALDTTLRFSLFRLAVHYWEARWLEDCRAQARQLAEEAKEREKTGIKSVRPRWRRRMKLTPCIVSTLHALPSHMMHGVYEGPGRFRQEYLENEIDLLIIDEAGQVAPEVAGASFALARRALVIGDVHQIKPVSTQVKAVDVGNLRHEGLLDTVDDYDDLRDTGRSVVDGSVMRIAQLASRYRYLAEAEPGMFLQEHRRCLNAIIAYCNDLCYRGVLLPMRNTPAKDPTWPPFSYVHVDGRVESPLSGSRVNRLEAETLAEWLATHRASLEDRHGKSLHEIVGVVTPFKAQAQLIIEACHARDIPVGDDAHAVTVGTVHALQGAERPIILFSAVYSRHDDGGFIDRDPSMLNVAVSRAKDSFMVFGDMDVIADAAPDSPRYLLGRYLFADDDNQQTFIIDSARPDLLALCRHPQVINDAEEHDRCIRQLLESVRCHVALVSPWISLERLSETGLLHCLFQAVERGVEVTVYVDHHFNTTSANQPDAQKAAKLSRCQEVLQEAGVRVRVVKRVHSKLIMADDRFMCVGSYNWASAARSGPYKNMETSMLYSGNLREEIRVQLDALNHRAMLDERDESHSLAG